MRPVESHERPALFDMVQAFWGDLRTAASRLPDPARRAQVFEDRFGPEAQQWWALWGEARVGFCNLSLSDDLIRGRRGYIDSFYITPEHRRRGYGRAFARDIIAHLKREGAATLDLTCSIDNAAALAFWQSLGFTVVTQRLRQTF